MFKVPIKKLQLLDCLKIAGLQAGQFSSQSNTGQQKPILRGLRNCRLRMEESSSIGSPLMYTVKMGVLILTRTDGKVNQARYESSPRAIEPIYSLSESFSLFCLRESERELAAYESLPSSSLLAILFAKRSYTRP